ncbi:low temperature requirement protein A [Actinocatenispora comari]|uniref:Membrane protein n=1 Tax=Actinocatenispora comari TaxID=2807577 RepID=A0A8J4AAK5_9ACTN|nr:low temperature requirement protein A [Actinocatenispora comari]GIL25248.1 membrane protein [Actinocatenispora comari]
MTEEQPEKRVSWAELFFDLVFVFAITEVSELVAEHHSWLGVLRALTVFVPLYWTWVGASMQANLRDLGPIRFRLALFAVGLTGLFMALAVPAAYGDRGLLFAASYWVGRLLLAGIAFAGRDRKPNPPFLIAAVVSGPLLVIGGLLDGPARLALWATAAVIDLAAPTVTRSRLRALHFDAPHLTERFGLLVLIALGESVVAIGAPAAAEHELSPGVLGAVAAAFALSCGLWWVYFQYAQDAMRFSMATAQVQNDVARHVLSYAHLSFVGAIIAAAVGMREAVAHPGEHLNWAVTGLLYGGAALYLATFGYTRWQMFRLVSTTRLAAAGVVLVLLPIAPFLPALAALALLGTALAALNAIEYYRVHRAELAAARQPG